MLEQRKTTFSRGGFTAGSRGGVNGGDPEDPAPGCDLCDAGLMDAAAVFTLLLYIIGLPLVSPRTGRPIDSSTTTRPALARKVAARRLSPC